MAAHNLSFKFDQRNLPDNLKTADQQNAFADAVLAKMQDSVLQEDALFAAVLGMLILDGYTDPTSGSFDGGFWSALEESSRSTTLLDKNGKPTEVKNKLVYEDVGRAPR